VVEVGEDVRRGQRIGHSDAFVSAEVHASASGKVLECRPALHPVGADVLSLVIAADAEADAQVHFAERPVRLEEMEPVAIRQAVQEAGIVGMGGAGFPTHVKISPPADTPIDTVIVNGCECEPGLTADHRLMVERTADVLLGLRAILRAVGAERAFIGIEANKPDAVAEMRRALVGEGLDEACAQDHKLGENEILLKETFWDKQIVDIHGSKVVRVNDLQLAPINHELRLIGADIGVGGLLRSRGGSARVRGIAVASGDQGHR
jgi:Na+-translocating ferredoxin:NAD+ oxidoreductase RnfC subunit